MKRPARRFGKTQCQAAALALIALVACTGATGSDRATGEAVKRDVAASAMAEPDQQEWQRLLGPGWIIIGSSHGSIRGSELPVSAVLAEGTDLTFIKKNDGLGISELDLNPRRLVMVEQAPSGWKIWVDFQGWLPRAGSEDTPCLLDPFAEGGVSVVDGSLQIATQHFYGCGSWYISNQTFKFHRDGNRLRLIGKESYSLHRASHEVTAISTNFLSHRQEVTFEPGPDGEEGTVENAPKKTIRRIARKVWYIEDMDPEVCWDGGESLPAWCDQ